MKFSAALVFLVSGAMAFPPGRGGHHGPHAATDELLFKTSLPDFTNRRNAHDPSDLIWASDGCSSSPDNPFGFHFNPACYRHDFGYRNYKDQSRFTDKTRLRLDRNLKHDLYHQCRGERARRVCEGLADVYYEGVRAFGRGKPTLNQLKEVHAPKYAQKVATYHRLAKQAQDKGILSWPGREEEE